jgi:hypothetical protein
MTTATRPARTREAYRQAEPQTLHQRIHAVRESYPGLREARLAVLELRSEENGLLGKLQAEPSKEDPHAHDSVRQKLATLREKIGPAQQAERTIELEASKSAMAAFLPEHTEAAAAFVGSLEALFKSHGQLMELRNMAISMRLPLNAKTAFFGLDQLAGMKPQLLQIQSLWNQG